LRNLRAIDTFSDALRLQFAGTGWWNLHTLFGRGISILNEDSYLSRFLAKFVEIIAAGLATAISAYLIAHLGGSLSASRVMPAAVATVPAAPGNLDAPKSLAARSIGPVTAAADDPRPASQSATEAAPAQPARKTAKAAPSGPMPAAKEVRGSTGAVRGERSAEALARAALANLDAERSPADESLRRVASASSSAPTVPVEVRTRPAEAPTRQAEMPPPAPVEAALPRITTVDLPPPSTSPPESAAPQPASAAAGEADGLLSVPKRILHLLRPGTQSLAGEAPRPPMPVAAAPRG
jgi:hypothetical protein